MPRIHTNPRQNSGNHQTDTTALKLVGDAALHKDAPFGTFWDQLTVKVIFAAACVAAGYHFHPFGLTPLVAAAGGLLFSVSVFLFEVRLQRASLRRLIGAAIGSILGILGAYLMGLVLARTSIPENSRSFIGVSLLLVMTYIGLVLGAIKGDML